MNSKNTLQQTNEFAAHYDEYIAQTNWYGPQMLFGLMYEYILPEENLLDLGIGTGLSSMPFHALGLNIYGLDGAEEMLKICKLKGFTEDLKLANLEDFKSPYGLAIFDHAISNGVFHLVGDLKRVFSEVSRSLRKAGIFGFTVFEFKEPNIQKFNPTEFDGVYSKLNEESGITVFQHSNEYIQYLLYENHFKQVRHTEFLGYRDEKTNREYYFSAYIVQKIE
jgi:predicted TPR repeat methyltransferase